jgi:hypothetical protein
LTYLTVGQPSEDELENSALLVAKTGCLLPFPMGYVWRAAAKRKDLGQEFGAIARLKLEEKSADIVADGQWA